MERRGFFGSILGTIIGSQIPFQIEESKEEIIIPHPLEFMYQAYKATHEELMNYKLVCITDQLQKFYFPKMKEVNRTEQKICFVSYGLEFKQPLTAIGVRLINTNNIIWKDICKFSRPVTVNNGDTIHPSYTLSIGE